MTISRWIASSLCLAGVCAAGAQLRVRPRFAVGTDQVARTIAATFAERGIQVAAAQVVLPAEVLAREEEPVLELSAIQPLGQLTGNPSDRTSAGVKLKCKTPGVCLPFYAVVTWQAGEHVAGSEARLDQVLLTARSAAPPAITAGAHVTMLMEADHASIRMDVISLGSAAVGKPIRVSTPDHKHVYQAVVADSGLVKGSF